MATVLTGAENRASEEKKKNGSYKKGRAGNEGKGYFSVTKARLCVRRHRTSLSFTHCLIVDHSQSCPEPHFFRLDQITSITTKFAHSQIKMCPQIWDKSYSYRLVCFLNPPQHWIVGKTMVWWRFLTEATTASGRASGSDIGKKPRTKCFKSELGDSWVFYQSIHS